MIVRTIKTDRITAGSHTLHQVLDAAIPSIDERSIVVVTSKIISLCEGSVVKVGDATKDELIRNHAQWYIDPATHPLGITLTITDHLLVPTAGIDESNANGYYILWPKNVHKTAQEIRMHLADKFGRHDIGVLVTDSKTTPMRWGLTGIALSYAGFAGLNDFIGKPDLFGRPMEVTKVNVADGLAAAAVLCMGESNEQTPLAVITDVPFIRFDASKPSHEELREWQIPMDTDLYGPLLKKAPWQKGMG